MTHQQSPILITGGTGFLGSYVIKNLVERGLPVRSLRRSTSKLPFYIPSTVFEKVEWVEGDVLDVVALGEAMQGVQGVIHAAAIVSFDQKERSTMHSVNIDGTANVVNLALENNVRRFIHVSSVAALGRTSHSQLVSESKKWEDNSNNTHYAISKHHAEINAFRGFAEGLEGAIVNPSTILGFGNWHNSSCAIFKNAYREFPWYTEGVNGFVGVEDTAEAIVSLYLSQISGKRFIINSDNWSFQRLFDCLADGFGKARPHRKATAFLGGIAWRMEALKSLFTGKNPLLTRETAKVAQSKTSFDNSALLKALPNFRYTPLETVIGEACQKYKVALEQGEITL